MLEAAKKVPGALGGAALAWVGLHEMDDKVDMPDHVARVLALRQKLLRARVPEHVVKGQQDGLVAATFGPAEMAATLLQVKEAQAALQNGERLLPTWRHDP